MNDKVIAAAERMRLKREELIDLPLARIWRQLAEVALSSDPWQPIETAPKDGSDVLCINMNANKPSQCVVHYRNDNWIICNAVDYNTLKKLNYDFPIQDPTHWQPLPKPPKKKD